MEGGIKHCHIGLAGHQLHAGPNSHQVGRIVQRSQIAALFNYGDHLVVNHSGFRDFRSAMEYSVSDGLYFIQAL